MGPEREITRKRQSKREMQRYRERERERERNGDSLAVCMFLWHKYATR